MTDELVTSEAWNVGFQYSNEMIFQPLLMVDKLGIVALYGAEDLEISMNLPKQIKNQARINSIDRMITTLKKVFDNSEFKIKPGDRDIFKKLEKDVDKVIAVKSGLFKKEFNQIDKTEGISINENHFNNCFLELTRIRRAIVPLLNNAGFIFKTNEDLNVKSIHKRFVDEG